MAANTLIRKPDPRVGPVCPANLLGALAVNRGASQGQEVCLADLDTLIEAPLDEADVLVCRHEVPLRFRSQARPWIRTTSRMREKGHPSLYNPYMERPFSSRYCATMGTDLPRAAFST